MNNTLLREDIELDMPVGSLSSDPTVLADIYQSELNIAIWQRTLSSELQQAVAQFVTSHPTFQLAMTLRVDNALTSLTEELGRKEPTHLLAEDLSQIIDMFGCLFDLKRVGVRLTAISKAMCPKFHVDNVPCRLVTTYHGDATEWLPNHGVDRSKLGHGSMGLADHESGLYPHSGLIQRMDTGDVALLKGERWDGNENFGLIHRSPQLNQGESRLLLTLDFSG
ncbi:DUF1826 domain-containing protein [Veronia pacifica]|uniref:Succinylglutamate desuccinylase n=1 Tax=Veronia pacifica TaxID=1080227 RepID=A0A1C3E960_9GAMM|nr:DUF1826 domain-containing protein [Veronia pacifica]ODA29807.1 succinylglutamate desuccinylase [Veronia pacifica]